MPKLPIDIFCGKLPLPTFVPPDEATIEKDSDNLLRQHRISLVITGLKNLECSTEHRMSI